MVPAADKLDRKPAGEQVDYVDIVQVANILSYEQLRSQINRIDTGKFPHFNGSELI